MKTSFTDWESGSYLEHYGVPGMKWGVRRYQNEDGSYTSAGQRHYARQLRRAYTRGTIQKVRSNKAYAKINEATSRERQRAQNAIGAVYQHEMDFYKNRRLSRHYQNLAAKEMAKMHGLDRKAVRDGYRYGDLDQGSNSSYETYLRSNKKAQSERSSKIREAREASSAYERALMVQTQKILGKYGDKKINRIITSNNVRIRDRGMRLADQIVQTYGADLMDWTRQYRNRS